MWVFRAVARVLAFFKKRDRNMYEEARPFLWAIEDPQDETNDLGRNSYACRQVKSAFEHAFTVITAPVDSRDGFLLRRIVQMDPSWAKSRQPPAQPGAIRGVALDFPKYVKLGRQRAAHEQKQVAEARGKKRGRDVVDVASDKEDGGDSSDESSSSSSSSSDEEEGQAPEEQQPKKKRKGKRGKSSNKRQKIAQTPGGTKKGAYFAKGRPQ